MTKPGNRALDIVVVTGMSGSGKSTAIRALEDAGYYCIDNLPTAIVPRAVELWQATGEHAGGLALGMDLRDQSYVDAWDEVRTELEDAGHTLRVAFLDSSDEILTRRFSETRRKHPLRTKPTLSEALVAERAALAHLRDTADLVIDTGELNVHQLKRRIHDAFAPDRKNATGPTVTIRSFGYKYGVATDADVIFDVRFLPNPFFVEKFRRQTGLNEGVARFVLDREVSKTFLEKVTELLKFLLPHYAEEGKAYLTIALGCTGGQHRSVAIAEEVAARLASVADVAVRHRDISRADT